MTTERELNGQQWQHQKEFICFRFFVWREGLATEALKYMLRQREEEKQGMVLFLQIFLVQSWAKSQKKGKYMNSFTVSLCTVDERKWAPVFVYTSQEVVSDKFKRQGTGVICKVFLDSEYCELWKHKLFLSAVALFLNCRRFATKYQD